MQQTNIHQHNSVIELAEIQRELGLPDADFCRVVKLDYSGSSWGKIKAGTFSGNAAKALAAVQKSLAIHRAGGTVKVDGDVVMFDHVHAALDAVDLARRTTDEHRLVIVSGSWGAGKSTIARKIHQEHGGHYFHAKPSWSSSYLRALMGIAEGIGLGTNFRSVGQGESDILSALRTSPGLLIIDEANHFNRDSLNFLKALLNETKAVIAMMTLPGHLARIAATASEETRQLLRRVVAIIHIGPVSSADVMAVHAAFFPEIRLGTCAPAIAACANRHARMDTVLRVFRETDPDDPDDLQAAIARTENAIRTILQQ